MKNFILALAAILIGPMSYADPSQSDTETTVFAQPIQSAPLAEEVPIGPIRLIGKGYQNARTQESIAIACAGPDGSCSLLRFVYVNPFSQKAYYVGQAIKVEGNSDLSEDQQLQTVAKRSMKEFKKWRKENFGFSTRRLADMTDEEKKLVQFVGISGLSLLLWLNPGSLPVAIAGTAGFFVISLVGTGDITLNLRAGLAKSATTAAYDRNGWNWSSKPAKMRNKVFNQLFSYLTQNQSETNQIRKLQ